MDEDPSNEAYVLSLLEGYDTDEAEAMDIEPAPCEVDWRDKYIAWMDRGELPSERSEARHIARMAKSFTLVNGELYKRAASGILQRCVPIPQGRAPPGYTCGRVRPSRSTPHLRGQCIPPGLILAHRGRRRQRDRAHL
jgi:hypothetical protein